MAIVLLSTSKNMTKCRLLQANFNISTSYDRNLSKYIYENIKFIASGPATRKTIANISLRIYIVVKYD